MNISAELQTLLANSSIRLVLRHGTAADWTAANPVLLLGEVGVELDTGREKIGDGVTAWIGLPYRRARATAVATTSSLAAGAKDSTTKIGIAYGFVLYSIQTSRPARVQLYSTDADKTADASRAPGVDPTTPVLLDYVTIDNAVHRLSPKVVGANEESTLSANISMRVTNNDTVTGTVTVTLTYLRTE